MLDNQRKSLIHGMVLPIELHYFSISFVSVERVQGEVLVLHKVKRSQMGNYLCIASNGYPPTVSRRVELKINCKLFFLYNFGYAS